MQKKSNTGMESVIDLIWTVDQADDGFQPRNIMPRCDGGGSCASCASCIACCCTFAEESES